MFSVFGIVVCFFLLLGTFLLQVYSVTLPYSLKSPSLPSMTSLGGTDSGHESPGGRTCQLPAITEDRSIDSYRCFSVKRLVIAITLRPNP